MKLGRYAFGLVVASSTAAAIWYFVATLRPDQTISTDDVVDDPPTMLVRMTSEKFAAAGIEVQPVQRQSLQLTRSVPGRFRYDEDRHVAVRTPVDGVLDEVFVKPADSVEVGQTLAVMRSPTVGEARSGVLTSQSAVAIAQKDLRWRTELHEGVRRLVEAIQEGESIDAIKQRLGDQTLGQYGDRLLTAYSQSIVADQLVRSISDIAQQGAISGRVARQREADQQQTRAALRAAMEASEFETQQAMATAAATAAAAGRDRLIADQRLATVLGSSDATRLSEADAVDVDLSRLTIVSPIAGTVERRVVASGERVAVQDELFVIADTSTLWVEADLRGRDWGSIRVEVGDRVDITTPAIVDSSVADAIQGVVHFIGREVDPASGAIPVVAKIDNQAGHYRPGLFARVMLPTQRLTDTIVVPESAVIEIEGRECVFVQEGDAFRCVAVQVGQSSQQMVQIIAGIEPGQRIATAGVFMLKSELLLEGEE